MDTHTHTRACTAEYTRTCVLRVCCGPMFLNNLQIIPIPGTSGVQQKRRSRSQNGKTGADKEFLSRNSKGNCE